SGPHGADDLRRRRPGRLRELPRAVAVRVSDERDCWWTSPFGHDAHLGLLNHITDATRAAALRLVRSGRLYDLGRVLDADVPAFPWRYLTHNPANTAHP